MKEYIYDMEKDIGKSNVDSLCIMKGAKGAIPWQRCYDILKELFEGSEIRITICTGVLRYAKISDHDRIFDEFHDSVVGAHLGVDGKIAKIRKHFY